MVADFSQEIASGFNPVCGVDEVGRGPWAGPIVAGAAILASTHGICGIADSKKLTVAERERISVLLHQHAAVGIGIVDVETLDRIGLTAANDLAMARAIAALPERPAHALVDGKRLPKHLGCPCTAIVKGDAISLSIAAASIVAKVARDGMMRQLARRYPKYGWDTNVGYGTARHREAIRLYGITPYHRRSFKPIMEISLKEQRIEY